jgi:hypothetical protein
VSTEVFVGPTNDFLAVGDGRTGVEGCADADGWADVASLVGWFGWFDCAAVGCVACVGLVLSAWVGAGSVECVDAPPVEGAGSVGRAGVCCAVD